MNNEDIAKELAMELQEHEMDDLCDFERLVEIIEEKLKELDIWGDL